MGGVPDPNVAREIEDAIVGALSRRGVSGKVVVRQGIAELHGSGPVVAIELGDWVEQWSLLPPDLQARRAEVAADRLRTAIAQTLPAPATPTDIAPVMRNLVMGIAVLAALGGIGFWLIRANFFGKVNLPIVSSAGAAESSSAIGDPTARDRALCDAARKRVYAGAAMDLDPAGWVIELWLARASSKKPLAGEDVLRAASDQKLSGRLGATAPASATWVDTGEATRAMLRFEGGYLRAFLQADGRDRFIALTDELADAVDVDHAALWARCAHSSVRDIGAYYRGRDAAGAATALLFAQGLFADPMIVDKSKVTAKDGALAALGRAAAPIEEQVLEELVSDNGGRVMTREPDAGRPRIGLLFALGGPTRAQQAAKAVAKQVHVD